MSVVVGTVGCLAPRVPQSGRWVRTPICPRACLWSLPKAFWQELGFALVDPMGCQSAPVADFLVWEKLLLLGTERAGGSLEERGAVAVLLLAGGMLREARHRSVSVVVFQRDAAGFDGAEHGVIAVQARFRLSGQKQRLPRVCSFTLFAGR